MYICTYNTLQQNAIGNIMRNRNKILQVAYFYSIFFKKNIVNSYEQTTFHGMSYKHYLIN